MPTEVQRSVFRRALQRARADAGYSQRSLADRLGISSATVALWEVGKTAPRPETTTRLEEVLAVPEGTFGRVLGQLPPSVVGEAISSVVEAIEADSRLSNRERRLLRTMYREFIREDPERSGD